MFLKYVELKIYIQYSAFHNKSPFYFMYRFGTVFLSKYCNGNKNKLTKKFYKNNSITMYFAAITNVRVVILPTIQTKQLLSVC